MIEEHSLSSWINETVFSLFLPSKGPIPIHNCLHLSFVLFIYIGCGLFRVIPKKPWPSPFRPISATLPSVFHWGFFVSRVRWRIHISSKDTYRHRTSSVFGRNWSKLGTSLNQIYFDTTDAISYILYVLINIP